MGLVHETCILLVSQDVKQEIVERVEQLIRDRKHIQRYLGAFGSFWLPHLATNFYHQFIPM